MPSYGSCAVEVLELCPRFPSAGLHASCGWPGKQDLQVELGGGYVLMQGTFLRVKLLRWHQSRELMEIASGTASLHPQGVLGSNMHHYLPGKGFTGTALPPFQHFSLFFLTIFLLMWVVQAARLDAAPCCVPLGCMAPWKGMCSLPSASPLWQGMSFASLVQQNCSLQVGSDCARISTEIPHSSCTGIFSSNWWGWLRSASHQAGSPASSQPGSTACAQPVQDNRGCLCLAACCWDRQPWALLRGQGVFLILLEFCLSVEGLLQLLAMISSTNDNDL